VINTNVHLISHCFQVLAQIIGQLCAFDRGL